jgi:uncharacterized coiled-coil DUF342 family protein
VGVELTIRFQSELQQPHDTPAFFNPNNPEFQSVRLKQLLKRPQIMTLPGCFTCEIGQMFAEVCDVSHIWRVTVPMLASTPHPGRNHYSSPISGVSERLNYELTHQWSHSIKKSAPDVVFLDAVSDFGHDYFTNGETIIGDLGSGLHGADWQRLTATSLEYHDIYINSLIQIIQNKLFGNANIVFLKRRIASRRVGSEGLEPINLIGMMDAQTCIDRIYSSIEKMGIVTVIEPEFDIYTTDRFAPWGEWAFHPSEEIYLLHALKICDHFRLNSNLRTKIIGTSIAKTKQRRLQEYDQQIANSQALTEERDSLIAYSQALTEERDSLIANGQALIEERDSLIAGSQALIEERDSLIAQRQTLGEDRDSLVAHCQTVTEERDNLIANGEALIEERDSLIAQRQTLGEDRDSLVAHCQTVTEERDNLIANGEALIEERDSLIAHSQALIEERASLIAQTQALGEERDTLLGHEQARNEKLAVHQQQRPKLINAIFRKS